MERKRRASFGNDMAMLRVVLASVGIVATLSSEILLNAHAAQVAERDLTATSSAFLSRDSGYGNHQSVGRHLSQTIAGLIQGGQNAERGRFPFISSLRNQEDAHICGGVLILEDWVLTAAHCVDPSAVVDGTPLGLNPQLVIGALQLSDDAGTFGVEVVLGEVFLHESWNGDLLNGFDIALVKLPKPSKHQTIQLAARGAEFVTGQRFVAVGWGSQGSGRSLPDTLQWAPVIHRDNEKCNLEDAWNGIVTPQMICAGGTVGDTADICKGDSGGPLIVAHAPGGNEENGKPELDLLVGLISFGELPGCDSEEPFEFRRPIVYTRVSEFRDWIDETTGTQIPDDAPAAAGQQEEKPSTTPTPSAGPGPSTVAPVPPPQPRPQPSPQPRPQPRPQPKPQPRPSQGGGGRGGGY